MILFGIQIGHLSLNDGPVEHRTIADCKTKSEKWRNFQIQNAKRNITRIQPRKLKYIVYILFNAQAMIKA